MTAPAPWKKSSYSGGGEGNDCVEVATGPAHISVRDSKDPAAGALSFPAGVFVRFLSALKVEPYGHRGR
ncbi:DUF397 domain-containing protein [Streptomyces sp. NPDC127079]|uniref:DUF397 domain-containing protein n=1 Tax=Streptomyces sp. NPDC127079 TaxID=3347132 RepID=UPI00366304C9